MTQILQNRLYLSGYNAPVLINVVAAYSPATGVKGGLRFMNCTKTSTGIYRGQLKNIFRIKNAVSSLSDGDFTFNFDTIKFYQANLNYSEVAAAGDLSIYSCSYFNTSSKIMSLLTFNSSGVLTDSTSDMNIPHTVTFQKFRRGLS